jgi:nickel-dependent lactate racemase
MQVIINYGMGRLSLKLPDNTSLNEYGYIGNAKNAIDRGQFLSLIKSAEANLFPIVQTDIYVVNDAYRPTPTERIFSWLKYNGKFNPKAKFLIATGCHQKPNPAQLHAIFGSFLAEIENNIIVHNARDETSMVTVGLDKNGEAIRLNRHFVEAEKIVVIGSVEPHYFAGFTGGRKSIFPGLCDYDTTVRNHNLSVSFDASPIRLDGNPIEEHFRFMMQFVANKNIFAIQVVGGYEGNINAIVCGKLDVAFRKATIIAGQLYGQTADNKYDLILAEVRPPLDSNLYQLQKSLENCQNAVADGGMVILFSACHEGIGSDAFYKLADKWRSDQQNAISKEDSFGIHKLYRVKKISERIDVLLHSMLPEGRPDKVYFGSCPNPQSTIDDLSYKKGELKAALVHDAGHTVMIVN